MGNICINKQQTLRSSEPRSNSNVFSFIKSNSTHDHEFLGYLDIPKLNQLLREVITEVIKPQSVLIQLDIFKTQIQYYLEQLKTQGSKTNKKLAIISQKIKSNNAQGYIIFEIQRIELAEIPAKLKVEVSTDNNKLQFKKQLTPNNLNAFNTSSLFIESTIRTHKILIKLNQYICTLDISEVRNKIFVLEKINIKDNTQLLTIRGDLVLRIQYIQDTVVWKSQLLKELELKLQQVNTIKQCLQRLVKESQSNDNANTKDMLLKYIEESEIMTKENELTFKHSFYENQFEI